MRPLNSVGAASLSRCSLSVALGSAATDGSGNDDDRWAASLCPRNFPGVTGILELIVVGVMIVGESAPSSPDFYVAGWVCEFGKHKPPSFVSFPVFCGIAPVPSDK